MAQRIYLVRISGLDQVGVLAGVTSLLAGTRTIILDVGESVIHSTLSLGLLVQLRPDTDAELLSEKLRTLLEPTGLNVAMDVVSESSYAAWVERGGQMRHIVTVLANPLTAEQLQAVSSICAQQGLNIDRMRRLSGRLPISAPASELHCVELSVRGKPKDEQQLRAACLQVNKELQMDISVQKDDIFRRHRRLVAFDMDSTLITVEVVDVLAGEAGHAEQVKKITEDSMQGRLDFSQSLRSRTEMLKGLPEAVLKKTAENMRLNQGAEYLIQTLKRLGYKVAIISGGFDYFARMLGNRLGADYVFANELETRDGLLTGRIVGKIVDRKRKAELLREISGSEGITMEQVIAVGDGANDIEMLSAAGLGVAYHAKPTVVENVGHAISQGGLDTILFLLGISAHELDDAVHSR